MCTTGCLVLAAAGLVLLAPPAAARGDPACGAAGAAYLAKTCGGAQSTSATDCLVCCGVHQGPLKALGCGNADFDAFCHGKSNATAALLNFKASGGGFPPRNALPLASWRNGTDPCGGKWEGVTCSRGVVTKLDLSVHISGKFKGVAGDLGALSPLVNLTYLDLSYTDVAGDVKDLAPLVQLTFLDLKQLGKLAGQAAALAPLVRLTYLNLDDTAASGHGGPLGCYAFCAAGGPFHTHCDPTHGAGGCSNIRGQGCWC